MIVRLLRLDEKLLAFDQNPESVNEIVTFPGVDMYTEDRFVTRKVELLYALQKDLIFSKMSYDAKVIGDRKVYTGRRVFSIVRVTFPGLVEETE